ncbi:hypothetical protein DL764_006835 [Monosporascus ibericus]|uniref:Uncharacterized protein n=1 Tax=Monosporascus ibericus TaxID=155417 RepID=A0A4Q4T6Y3_9PEZI|nr:hypothetical protein DL764_006835 [Monosporascus ibericus]
MKRISDLLSVKCRPEARLLAVTEKQHTGSCAWLTTSEEFQEWLAVGCDYGLDSSRDRSDRSPRFLWLNGPPGSGKSVAAGHVIRYLESCNFDCSFFFFDHRDREKSSLSELLRSLAFQMASSNLDVRAALLEIADNDVPLPLDDHNMVWATIFKNRILRTEFSQTQFWVVDALDECSNRNLSTLGQMLSKIDIEIPLRIFFTGRTGAQIERMFSQQNAPILEIRTGSQGSLSDIASYVRWRWMPSVEPAVTEQLLAEVLRKSNGIFLWASLILDRLEDAYSLEDMQDIIQQVPSEMDDFYMRIIKSVAASQSAELAKCILKWTTCAARSLSTKELKEAVRADINKTLTVSDDRLAHVCGHLITIDNDSRVQIIHQTVSAFLTQERSDLWIEERSAHSQLAEICLGHLNGEEFTPPRARRIFSDRRMKTAFSNYACTYFSYHLSNCSPALDAPLVLLDSFLATNCLTWIEKVAETGSLATLNKTIQNLRIYLAGRERVRSPPRKEDQHIRSWINDIAHVATEFGPNLLDSPSSIHFLVPPLCPPASAIHRLFAKSSRQFRFIGSSEQDWDDRISCFLYPADALSVASNGQFLATGLANGKVMVYDNTTFEVAATLTHGEQVTLLSFGSLSSILAACGPHKITLWSHRQIPLWSSSLEAVPLEICFNSDDTEVFIPRRDGAVTVFNIKDGRKLDEVPLNRTEDSDSDEGNLVTPGTPPSVVRLSLAHRLAAIAYRNSPITIWDLDRANQIGIFEKEGCEQVYNSPQVIDMVFNPAPQLDLMAVAYGDGDLVTCDPWTLEQHRIHGILVHVLAASPDGRTLATGDSNGVVHLFAFETLRLVYRVAAIEDCVRNIVFASSNIRFFDVRGGCCNVWEPSTLIHREGSDDASSESQSEELIPAAPAMVVTRLFEEDEAISVIEHPPDANFVICGRENGSISIHDLSTGRVTAKLRFHARMVGIRDIKWNHQLAILVSVDDASRCIATRLALAPSGEWQQVQRLFEGRVGKTVLQVLLAPDGSAILLRTIASSELWKIGHGLTASVETGESSTWVSHPTKEEQLILLQVDTVRVFTWAGLVEITTDGGIPLGTTTGLRPLTSGMWVSRLGYNMIAGAWRLEGQETGFTILEVANIGHDTTQLEVALVRKKLHSHIKVAIGLFRSSLYFLDTRGWICSIGVKAIADVKFYTRHFFIPLAWQTASQLALKVITKNSIAFAHQDQLKIFHGFLDFEEKVYFRDSQDP